MVSKRYRSNKTITNKISDLDARTSKQEKKTTDPHLSGDAVSGENIADGSLESPAFAPDAVTDSGVARGAVGTENLGVVNRLTSDSGLQITLPGYMYLDGAAYPPPAVGVEYPIVQRDDLSLVQGRITYDATVDPMWTSGLPNLTLSSGATVVSSGWNSAMGKPAPSQAVKAMWDGSGWYIFSAVTTVIPFPNQLTVPLKNGWTPYDGNWKNIGFTKTTEGIVHLTGLIKGGTVTTGTIICTLPVGFRPDYDIIVGVNQSDTTKQVVIRRNGNIEVVAGPYVGSLYLSLASVKFPAAGVASWKRFGIDAGFTFNASWTNYISPNAFQGAAATGTFTLTDGGVAGVPAGTVGNWNRSTMTSAGTNQLIQSGQVGDNSVEPGRVYTPKVYVRSSVATTLLVDTLILNEAETTVVDSPGVSVAVAANTWTLITDSNVTAPAGSRRAVFRVANNTAVANGVTLDLLPHQLLDTVTGVNAINDTGPVRIWQEPNSGQIFLQGTIAGGTATNGTAFFGTLPAAYRARYESIFFTVGSGNILGSYRAESATSVPLANTVVYSYGGNSRLPLNADWEPQTGSLLTWTNVSYQNGWADYGTPYPPGRYAKSSGGIVYIAGLIKSGSGVMFTLPVGMRITNPGASNTGTLQAAVGADIQSRVDMYSNGNVVFSNGSNAWFSLDGQSFVAEQ